MSADPPATRDAIERTPGWRRLSARTAGELQGLLLELRERTGPERVGFAEHLPRIVARRVGPRRRGAELHVRIEHPIEQCCGIDHQVRPHEGTKLVAGKQHYRPSALCLGQC